jgi:undecaprenyl-diphosphatase
MVAASLDARLAVWIATHRYPPLDRPFEWLGVIDKIGAVWVALAIVLALLQRRGFAATAGVALLTALTTFAADSATFAVKDVVHRTRPFAAHPEIHPLYAVHSSSFPAGHAATSFAGAALLSFLAPRAAPLFAVLAVAIAYSRVYVGVHYPGDILGGAAIGLLVAGVAILALLLVRARAAGRLPARSRLRPTRLLDRRA